MSFDFFRVGTVGALLTGAGLVVVPSDGRALPVALGVVDVEQVTVLNQTPSAFRAVQPSVPWNPAIGDECSPRHFGGEALWGRHVEPWLARFGDAGRCS